MVNVVGGILPLHKFQCFLFLRRSVLGLAGTYFCQVQLEEGREDDITQVAMGLYMRNVTQNDGVEWSGAE